MQRSAPSKIAWTMDDGYCCPIAEFSLRDTGREDVSLACYLHKNYVRREGYGKLQEAGYCFLP